MKIRKTKSNPHHVLLYPGIRVAALAVLACILNCVQPASAQPLPVNDNESAPFFGVSSGGLAYEGNDINDNFSVYLNRKKMWVLGFNGAFSTWSDVQGNLGDFYAARRWLDAHPGSKFILSVGMLPGTDPGGTGDPLGTAPNEVSHARGANGEYDTNFTILAQRLVEAGISSRTIIRLGWEFNGWWYPWRVNNNSTSLRLAESSPAYFAAYFARITTVMRAVIPGLEFDWCGCHQYTSWPVSSAYPKDIPERTVFPVHPAYPGNTYVNYVGTDIYDTSAAYPGDPAYSPAVRTAAWNSQKTAGGNGIGTWQYIANINSKPMTFPEWGMSQNTGNGGLDNPDFVQHMYDYIQDPANNVAYALHFNSGINSLGNFPNGKAKIKQLWGLPLPQKNNIGAVGVAGTCDGSTVSGGGTGYLTGTGDVFFFSSRLSPADDMFVAKINSMDAGAGAQSGIMVRQSMAVGDRYAAVFLRNGQCVFQSRTVSGSAAAQAGAPLAVAAPTPAAPVWLKLVRKTNSVTGYYSADGVNWNYAGGQTIALSGSTPSIGFAVSSGTLTTLNPTSHDSMDNSDFVKALEAGIPNKIIVDDADTAPGAVVKVGTWAAGPMPVTGHTSSYPAFPHGSTYLKATSTGPASTVTFTPTLPASGLYTVYAHWPQSTYWSYQVPITVTSSSGPTWLVADQSTGKGMWNYIGTYHFAQGTSGKVMISNSTTTSQATVADAVMFVPLPAPSIPAPWTNQDVGTSTPGNANYSGSTFTVNAGTGGFHYVYQPASGDCTIIARVASMTNTTDIWNKAGVSIRESLAVDSKQAMMLVTAGAGLRFEYKMTTGGTHYSVGGGSNPGTAPYWVKLVRSGGTFTGSKSTDGINWTVVGTKDFSMASTVYIGLPTYSSCTTTFDNVDVTP